MNDELKWQQHFENFKKLYLKLTTMMATDIAQLDEFQQMGITKTFELLAEISKKLLVTYLKKEGYANVKNGKQAIVQAYDDGIISDSETWKQIIEQRNNTAHHYVEKHIETIINLYPDKFYPKFTELYQYFTDKIK